MSLDGKVVLVTGGTGSFGKAFTRKVLAECGPKKLIIFSRDELKQYEMAQEFVDDRLRFFLGDVRDRDRLYRAFDGVDVVVHAAALKQVPAGEYNPSEFTKTNVDGALNITDAAIDRGVQRVIALSTDKAVNPANHYGATKLCSDTQFLASNSYSGIHHTMFSVARYGNVVGSRGSVVPFFKRCKEEGRAIPITHPDMTRFWLELTHAVDIVLRGLGDMFGGEIFVPKIPSVKITDLAKAIYPEGRQEVVGIRPGEKLHESLISSDDARLVLDQGDRYVICSRNTGCDGKLVPDGFSYTSDKNTQWLSVEDLELALL